MYDISVGSLATPLRRTPWVSGVHKVYWDSTQKPNFTERFARLFGTSVEVVGMGQYTDQNEDACEK